jgi:integrase/recombinase XerD
VTEYEKYLYRKGKKKWDVRAHMHTVARFLKFAEQQGCLKLTSLTPKCVFDAFKDSTNKCNFRNIIGAFLRYAYTYKLIDVNLSLIVPGVLHHTSVPTVYSPEEIEELLMSIDRQTELGKRNYAIILVAARLGLRACDIAAMKFDCLHLDTGEIEIVQVKTKQPLILPLLEDVKSAIYDYIDNARPQSADEHIFLNLRGYGAISPQTITTNVRRAFKKSGINRGNRKHGSHALRSSLATALLAEGNSYPTIQKVLGHRNIQSTRSYVKADIEKLRANALSVPPFTENYEMLLANVGAAV